MKCVDKAGHDYDFIGFMVVSDKIPKPGKTTPPVPIQPVAGTVATVFPIMDVPKHFPAKIEVHQCKKCGDIKLQPAVYTQILQGDKD